MFIFHFMVAVSNCKCSKLNLPNFSYICCNCVYSTVILVVTDWKTVYKQMSCVFNFVWLLLIKLLISLTQ